MPCIVPCRRFVCSDWCSFWASGFAPRRIAVSGSEFQEPEDAERLAGSESVAVTTLRTVVDWGFYCHFQGIYLKLYDEISLKAISKHVHIISHFVNVCTYVRMSVRPFIYT